MASLKNVKICFEAVSTANIDDLINHIKILLKRNKDQEVDLLKSGEQVSDVISGILEQVGKAYWTVAGLSMIGYLLTKVGQTSDNQNECLKLLQYMLDLADHIHRLERQDLQAKEKLKNTLVIIVKGSMLCAKQLSSNRLFRFMESSLDSKNLSSLLSEIKVLYPDLQLTAVPATLQQQPKRLPVSKPDYPAQAGIYK
ncbi:hypothetical protein SUGI_0364060 [Cryptomeria japonica]|nr:hypothetical protein SUGI_0364060 [Cryptomeria japonica]